MSTATLVYKSFQSNCSTLFAQQPCFQYCTQALYYSAYSNSLVPTSGVVASAGPNCQSCNNFVSSLAYSTSCSTTGVSPTTYSILATTNYYSPAFVTFTSKTLSTASCQVQYTITSGSVLCSYYYSWASYYWWVIFVISVTFCVFLICTAACCRRRQYTGKGQVLRPPGQDQQQSPYIPQQQTYIPQQQETIPVAVPVPENSNTPAPPRALAMV